MIKAEILKMLRNRETVLLWLLWSVLCSLLFFFLKYSFFNPEIYSVLEHKEPYVVYQYAFLKSVLFLMNFFLIMTLLSQRKLESGEILERKKILPVNNKTIYYNELIAFYLVFGSLSIISGIALSFGIYWLFPIEGIIYEALAINLIFWFYALLTTLCSISMFFMLTKLFKNNSMIIAFLLLFLISFFVKVFPVQWAIAILPQSIDNLEASYLYIALCLLIVMLPFIKMKLSNNYFLIVLPSLIGFLGCSQNNTDSFGAAFKPRANVVYIAFSLECDVCNDEIIDFSKSTQLNFEKIEFVSIDQKKEIELFKKSRKIDSQIKINVVSEHEFKHVFDTMSFPQAVVFEDGQKISLSHEFLKRKNLKSYVDNL